MRPTQVACSRRSTGRWALRHFLEKKFSTPLPPGVVLLFLIMPQTMLLLPCGVKRLQRCSRRMVEAVACMAVRTNADGLDD